jgi:hypothetical protein
MYKISFGGGFSSSLQLAPASHIPLDMGRLVCTALLSVSHECPKVRAVTTGHTSYSFFKPTCLIKPLDPRPDT